MTDKDFELFCERRNLLTDTGYFERWRALSISRDSRAAWEAVETELNQAFGLNRFLSYEAFHEGLRRNTGDTQRGRKRPSVRLYSEVNTV